MGIAELKAFTNKRKKKTYFKKYYYSLDIIKEFSKNENFILPYHRNNTDFGYIMIILTQKLEIKCVWGSLLAGGAVSPPPVDNFATDH